MKVSLPCYQCSEDVRGKPSIFELDDDGVYVVECEQQHRIVHTIGNAKFEILFEMALLALADGYTREAVATLAAATEEFFRIFVRMVLLKHKLYEGDLEQQAKKFWKLVDRSEPQLGAFALAYFLEKRTAPPFPVEAWTSFRNGVIHRGKIPKTAEVIEQGQRVVDFMVPLYSEYRTNTEMMIAGMVDRLDKIAKTNDQIKSTGGAGTTYASSFMWMIHSNTPSFSAAVKYAANESFLRRAPESAV